MSPKTIMFIHGLWLSAESWQPWQDFFERRGWNTLAPRYPGEAATISQTRSDRSRQAGSGIEDLTAHYRAAARSVDGSVVVIGHSIGGLIAQKLLGQNDVAGAIAVDPAPIRGVKPLPFTQLRSAFPVLRRPSNKGRAVALSRNQFRYAFGNALSRSESDELWSRWNVPSPARPLFEVASANLKRHSPAAVDVKNEHRGPLLMVSGTRDHTVPDKVTVAAHRLYAGSAATTEIQRLARRGHSLTVDHGWKQVAAACELWLEKQDLADVDAPFDTPRSDEHAPPPR